jgi:hypothetical protein
MMTNNLGQIAGATISIPDLDHAIAAYSQYLGYRGSTSLVGADLAARLGAPQVEGARMAMLWPESGERTFLRLIESPGLSDYKPLTTLGWNAIEIVVQDLTGLSAKLAQSPFKIIGEPRVLDFDFTDQISAMQVVGPGGEVLYLTEIKSPVPGFDLPEAKSYVGRIFVMILGTAALDAALAYFADTFGTQAGPVFQAKIEVLSDAFGMARSVRHTLTTLSLPEQSLIEVDAFPKAAAARPVDRCGLLPGIVMASFIDLSPTNGSKVADPARLAKQSLISAPIELLVPQST